MLQCPGIVDVLGLQSVNERFSPAFRTSEAGRGSKGVHSHVVSALKEKGHDIMTQQTRGASTHLGQGRKICLKEATFKLRHEG